MPLSKKGRIIIILGIVFCILGGGGTFGGLYSRAVSNITIEIDNIYVKGFSLGGSFLNPTIDVDLEIHATISNPTSIAVEVEYAMFLIYFDGEYSGESKTSPFVATRTPSPMVIDMLLDNIGGTQYALLFDLVVLGNSKIATIRITTVKVFGIAVEINHDINVTINQSDFLF